MAAGTVLVVDDEADICRMVERALRNIAETVHTCTDPTEALARIQAGDRFDLIICDVMMPRLTGIDLLRAIAGIDPAQADRLAFLTASTLPEEHESQFRGLSNTVLRKPISIAALRDFVRQRVG